MLLHLHSFSIRQDIKTEDIKAFVWNIELGKIELVLDEGKHVPLDEELWELEQMYQEGKE